MTAKAPLHIRSADTAEQRWRSPERGGGTYRLLVTASDGPSSDLVQGLTNLGPAESEAMHQHDRVETAFVVSGGGRLRLKGKDMIADAGDMLFIPAGQTHGWQAGEDGLRLLWTFPGDRFDEVAFHWSDD